MKSKSIIAVLITSLSLTSVFALDPKEMLRNLKEQLYAALAVKELDDTSVTTFVMCMPGIPLDPDIDMTQPDDLRNIYALLNFVPTGDITGQNSSEKMSDIYLHVLDGSKSVVENAKRPELQAKADDIEAKWSKVSDAYYRYQAAYFDAQSVANIAMAKKDPKKESLQSAADAAKTDWEKKNGGNRNEFEQLRREWFGLLYDVEGGEPWSARRARYSTAESQGFPVSTWPKYSSWTKPGWMELTFSSSDLQKTSHHSNVQAGGSAGFFGFGARGGSNKAIDTSTETLNSLSISLQVKRVLLDRPWMDAGTFRSRKWTWKEAGELPISFGVFNKDKKVFEGRMPLLPTSAILVRNVTLSGSWSSDFRKSVQSGMAAAGGFSFGPFSIGGNYANSTRDSSSRVQLTQAGITIPDAQIIGWYCDILPKCPNPVETTPAPTAAP